MTTIIPKIGISLFNYCVDQFAVLSSNSFWFYWRTRLDCESLVIPGSICECFSFPAEYSANATFVQISIPRAVCIMHAIVSTYTQFEYKKHIYTHGFAKPT